MPNPPSIHKLIRARLKVPEHDAQSSITLDELAAWSYEFERLMRNRLKIGALRYGRFQNQKESKFDNCGSAVQRIRKYVESGNTEYLVDAANLLMIEFEKGLHPNKHFGATDDGIHTKQL